MRTYRSKTVVVTLKLTPAEIESIDLVLSTGKFDSRSGVIRYGLGCVFAAYDYVIPSSIDRRIESERRIHKPRIRKKLTVPTADAKATPKKARTT